MTGEFSERPASTPATPTSKPSSASAPPSTLKRFILPLLLLAVMAATVGGIGFVIVMYAISMASQTRPFSYDEMDDLQKQDKIEEKEIPRLLACFEKNDEDLRIKAPETLAMIGKPAVEPLREKLKSKNAKVRFCAAQTFAFMEPAVFLDPKDGVAVPSELVACLDDSDISVRIKAVYAIGRIGLKDDAAFAGLIKALGDPNPDVSSTALERFKNLVAPPKGAVPALTKLAIEGNNESKLEALNVLTKMGEPAGPAFAELVKKSQGIDKINVINAAAALGVHAKPMLPDLQAYMITSPWWDNETAMLGIFKKCGPDGAKGLASVLKTLQDPKAAVNNANALGNSGLILKTLGEMGPEAKDATPELIGLLKDRDGLRPHVLETLGQIGPAAKEAIPAVQALATDPAVGGTAQATLKRLGAK